MKCIFTLYQKCTCVCLPHAAMQPTDCATANFDGYVARQRSIVSGGHPCGGSAQCTLGKVYVCHVSIASPVYTHRLCALA